MKIYAFIFSLLYACSLFAADSVDVTFRYSVPGSPTGMSVPGEFNNWNQNAWPMSYQGNSLWIRNARLAVGGRPGGSVPGAWQYKFYYNGVSVWPNDPLNHHINRADNDNSFIYVKDPTIYQFLPNQRNPNVTTGTPTITAYLFPKVGSVVDTSTISLNIDSTPYNGLGDRYNFLTKQFVYTLPSSLPNGSHTCILHAGTTSDTVTFTTQAGFVQFTSEFPFATWKTSWLLNGIVQDSTVTGARIVRNSIDTFDVVVSKKIFSASVPLVEGINNFTALADSAGSTTISSPVSYFRRVNHSPTAIISPGSSGGSVTLDAGPSSDPDAGQSGTLTFFWAEDANNPEPIGGINGTRSAILTFPKPSNPGEYYFTLIATDSTGNSDTTRNYFTLRPDGTIIVPTIASNPEWTHDGRMYFLFPKAVSAAGTLNAAAQRLQWIKDLGFNIIWMMPVMKNAFPIDNMYGPGYNIVDFFNVAPEYGTNQDFKNFVTQAHALGLKVILDVTPNHSSRFHPWSADAHAYKSNSPYWGWYEHQKITANTNGLGDCLDPDGFNYYCGFSDQLMNFNWTDADFRAEMIRAYKYWVQEFGVDGYRLDVYWGPHRRYGEQFMGKPVRAALKHIKPDILLLGEDDATGAGTETIFADYTNGGINGGVDAAYDWKLYHSSIYMFGFTGAAITTLHNDINNGGYYPGKNALFMRFMEDQDEDRIVYFYSNPPNFSIPDSITFMRTMPMASVLFTAPGIPMLWNGQEIGWGYGINGIKEDRSRSLIDWNYKGRYLLAPHYQKLATIRGQFAAFTQHKRDTNYDGQVTNADSADFVFVPSSNNIVYAFSRPYPDQNGLTVVNFSGNPQTTLLNLTASNVLKFSGGVQSGTMYYVNNLYTNTHSQISGEALDSVSVSLPSYGTAILTVSTTLDSATITNPITGVHLDEPVPTRFELLQNYPNPFNGTTHFGFRLPAGTPSSGAHVGIAHSGLVTLRIFDVLGRPVATLVNEIRPPGEYSVSWDASNFTTGVYFYRLESAGLSETKKLLLLR